MANIALQRIQKEIKEFTSDEAATIGIKIELRQDNLFEMNGEINGPSNTAYKDGKFRLVIEIPENYPFFPPKIKFTTRLWHPNVSSVTGTICLDVLKDQWTAAMTLRTVLLSIQTLLSEPQPNDPQDAVVAKQYLNNIETFNKTARYWAQFFASAPGDLDEEMRKKVDQIVEMCVVSPSKAIVELSHVEWDVARATARIFS